MNTPTETSAAAVPAAPLVLPAELTHQQGRVAQAMLIQTIRAQRTGDVVLDGSQLVRFDSTALAVVLACRRAALAQQQNFAVRQLPPHLQELATLYGVQDLLDGERPASAAA
ncbi:MAG: hypothetical protein GAK30_00631 [Paracidovorax wautersii]|uniref:MlaB-like STAS domain-containing protein n=1 Tax=Paracidovorax wautersii TaxID=1177982 RepID=A0A7V8JRD5_9BURK|nr:MAG: hypothetical protein GAK30_00631 [Paracidovorax wautersii]